MAGGEHETLEALGDFFEQRNGFGLPSLSITPEYESRAYWERVYQLEGAAREQFEWYGLGDVARPLLTEVAALEAAEGPGTLLELGCGNSGLSEALWAAGRHELLVSDFSGAVLQQMRGRAARLPALRGLAGAFVQLDAGALACRPAAFAAVLDKATADAFYLDGAPARAPAFQRLVSEVARVLRPRGRWLSVTRKTPLGWYRPFEPVCPPLRFLDPAGGEYFLYVLHLPTAATGASLLSQ